MSDRDGGPAFPQFGTQAYTHDAGCGDVYTVPARSGQPGMSLRDYFAAAAMPALAPIFQRTKIDNDTVTTSVDVNRLVACAYDVADAMLLARRS